MSKFPSLPGKGPKKVALKIEKESREDAGHRAEAGLVLQKFLAKAPPAAKAAKPATPPGGYKSGLSGQQYEGELHKDYSAMRPKLATKDKILNPIKSAIGLPGKAPKLVPQKPPKK